MSTRVHRLRLSMSNAYLVLSERPLLVDAGCRRDEVALEATLGEHGVALDDLAALVLTHGHTDHTGAADVVQRAGVPVIVGEGDAALVRNGRNATLPATGPAGFALRPSIRRLGSNPVRPDLELAHGESRSLADLGLDVTVSALGGHTPGSLVVHAGRDHLVGDLVRGGFGAGAVRPGHPLRHYFAEDTTGVRDALDAVLAAGPERLHPGHGGSLVAQDVRDRLDLVAPL